MRHVSLQPCRVGAALMRSRGRPMLSSGGPRPRPRAQSTSCKRVEAGVPERVHAPGLGAE
eukprot:6020662-Alexandrium_andersonii.AAC.1